jgi:hypothetical protein
MIFQGKKIDLTPLLDLIEAQIWEVELQTIFRWYRTISWTQCLRQTIDPRDKVFTILGPARGKLAQVRVDSDSSESIEDVYQRLDKAL